MRGGEPLIAEAWGLKEPSVPSTRQATVSRPSGGSSSSVAAVERAAIPSFDAFAKGVRSWRTELLAYFEEPTTNGYAEGVINKIKTIKRRAYGLPRFESFRQRVLVACG